MDLIPGLLQVNWQKGSGSGKERKMQLRSVGLQMLLFVSFFPYVTLALNILNASPNSVGVGRGPAGRGSAALGSY